MPREGIPPTPLQRRSATGGRPSPIVYLIINGVMDESTIPDGRGDVPWPRGGRGHAGGAATGRCGAHSVSKNAILEYRV